MANYVRGDVVRVRWPDLPNRPAEVHVAVVLSDDGDADFIVCAVGTSQEDRDEKFVVVDWRRTPAYRWVRGWPQGTGPTYFYAEFIQALPRARVERETEMSTGRIGAMPEAKVDEIEDLVLP